MDIDLRWCKYLIFIIFPLQSQLRAKGYFSRIVNNTLDMLRYGNTILCFKPNVVVNSAAQYSFVFLYRCQCDRETTSYPRNSAKPQWIWTPPSYESNQCETPFNVLFCLMLYYHSYFFSYPGSWLFSKFKVSSLFGRGPDLGPDWKKFCFGQQTLICLLPLWSGEGNECFLENKM